MDTNTHQTNGRRERQNDVSYKCQIKFRGSGGWQFVDNMRFHSLEEAEAWANYINANPRKIVRVIKFKSKPTHYFLFSDNRVERIT